MPRATVLAPDLPVHPAEAMALLKETVESERPDLIIGTSMGGMYTEMLYGFDRICVNPAFEMGATMSEHQMMGKQTFQILVKTAYRRSSSPRRWSRSIAR